MIRIRKIAAEVVNLTNNIVEKVDEVNNKVLIPLFISLIAFVLLLVTLIICPSHFQKVILRLSIAIGIAGLFSAISGSWKIKGAEYRGPFTFGMFVVVYLISSITVKGNCSTNSVQKGKIFLGKHPLEDATISLPQHDFQTFSNSKGEFLIEWDKKEKDLDSLLIHVQAANIDTSIYWKTNFDKLNIKLRDTLIPISRSIIEALITKKVETLNRKVKGNHLKWRINNTISLNELLLKYEPYNSFSYRYRNYFQFESLDQTIRFRKNLINAGIEEVREVIAPYEKHDFNSCTIHLIESKEFPNYSLDYLMSNSLPISYELNKLQRIEDNYYKVSISFQENIRDVRVSLNCSRQTNNYKIRRMEVYGFLPIEEYDLKFRHGKWTII